MEKIEKMTIDMNTELVMTIKELARTNGVPVDDIVNGLLLYALLHGRNLAPLAARPSDGAERAD